MNAIWSIAIFLVVIVGYGGAFVPGPALLAKSSPPIAITRTTTDSTDTSLYLFGRLFRSSPVKSDVTEKQVRALFTLWNNALKTGDSRIVAKRYADGAVLLPTVSDTPRTDYDGIKDYFDGFLQKLPQGEIVDGHITIGNGWAQDVGIYEFSLGIDNTKVLARYSFVYTQDKENPNDWKIAHHHSSVLPEGIRIPQSITKEEVQSLFGLWNDALATLDPKKVTERYSKDAVLLPTVSDTPRTDAALIEDYFVNFLKKKPQGKILSSNVIIGTNWAQDAGIYEFTMGADGSKVKARYSFIYVYEDGEWKISHHHSSIMPEGIKMPPAPPSEEEVRGFFDLWNDALDTCNSDQVAKRYAKDGYLLPTVSDIPRTDYMSIKSYFDDFLKKKPQGTILEGEITTGSNWAQDAGIYEFAMGADGSKVKARYSFVYVKEGDEWKISHHHSSVMPEGYLALAEEVNKEKAASA